MELMEGYYDCVTGRSMNSKLGECTVYTAYWDGKAAFTIQLYDSDPYCISIKENKDE